MKLLLKSLLLLICLSAATETMAHAPDHSYLYFRIYKDAMGGRVEMTTKDINRALKLNIPIDGVDEDIIAPHLQDIYNYIENRVAISSDLGVYKIRFTEPTFLSLTKMEDYVKFNFELDNVTEVPKELDVDYNILFDDYEKHRGMLVVEYNWKAGIMDNEALISNIFTPTDRKQSLNLEDASLWKGFVALVKLGIWHIWIGLDHILFIIALILPAVVIRREEGPKKYVWDPEPEFKPAFLYIIKIVTFFTIAHSITLALASLQIVSLPSNIVESIIAISIALAALHNITPIFKGKEWVVAFAFGLFHGFGFASVLGDKGLNGDFIVLSLLGFNVGVELGQLAIIVLAFPILFILRKTTFYKYVLKYGSVLLIIISIYWFIERAFEVDLPGGALLYKFLGLFGL